MYGVGLALMAVCTFGICAWWANYTAGRTGLAPMVFIAFGWIAGLYLAAGAEA